VNSFAELLDRVAFEHARNGKLRLLANFFRHTPDPDRGWALAAITGALTFRHAKPAIIRQLIAERTDPTLFAMSYDYVGDLSETVALLWPQPEGASAGHNKPPAPTLSEIIEILHETPKAGLPAALATLLDQLDETGRWALLKLITGSLRVGASARLAKTALASLGDLEPNAIAEVWPGLAPPYLDLFAWVEGRAARPVTSDPAPFHAPMLAHAIEEADLAALDPNDFVAEWKWDGIRVQAVAGRDADGRRVGRLYSRTGDDISAAFPDVMEAICAEDFGEAAVDGELLIVREGKVDSFGALQQRLNRKKVDAKLVAEYPAHIRAYDLLSEQGEDLRTLAFSDRRAKLEAFIAARQPQRFDLSPQVPFASWDDIARFRRDPASAGAGEEAPAIEGLMLKRADSIYTPGRPKGPWWKWKRDPFTVDAVLMYAQRGHGKRSSFYSDYTLGCWREGAHGDELVPVGKAYFGFTDAELKLLDKWVRDHTTNRFGPVREVEANRNTGLVLEIAFEGVQRSTRHKSGVAMRFPRVARIRWDKPARDADRLEALEALIGERKQADA
jgi:DNA ligase 1